MSGIEVCVGELVEGGGHVRRIGSGRSPELDELFQDLDRLLVVSLLDEYLTQRLGRPGHVGMFGRKVPGAHRQPLADQQLRFFIFRLVHPERPQRYQAPGDFGMFRAEDRLAPLECVAQQ